MNTYEITVKGLVQGIGYRPFIARLAELRGLCGQVRNTAGIVTIKLNAGEKELRSFLEELHEAAPQGACVEDILCRQVRHEEYADFSIVESVSEFSVEGEKSDRSGNGEEVPYIPADLPTCERCKEELFDPSNRRFRHPFISCVGCGPRYSIMERLPYDRETIVMREFAMCAECEEEYTAKADVRRHAQTICCKECGPRLVYEEFSPKEEEVTERTVVSGSFSVGADEEALRHAIACLRDGGIVAVKDIGGYHLACLPKNRLAVRALRRIKNREKKPFAVLFFDMGSVREYCVAGEREEEELSSPARPIVLLRKRPHRNNENDALFGIGLQEEEGGISCWAGEVTGTSPYVGAMLCCNPLQMLLTKELGPLVMTSANQSGDRMITDDEVMRRWMQRAKERLCTEGEESVRLGMLSHGRRILTPLDDSVMQIAAGRRILIRRARGYVPKPVAADISRAVFAAGADMKAAFCFTVPGKAYLSQPFGDLEEEENENEYQKELRRMKELFGFSSEIVSCDSHPRYRSREQGRAYAKAKAGEAGVNKESGRTVSCRDIRHHYAHAAAVIAEHGLKGAVLGIAFDGTGYGEDKSIWGSEFFLWDGRQMRRVGHLAPAGLAGGDEGAKNTDAILYGFLASLSGQAQEYYEENISKFPWLSKTSFEMTQKAQRAGINRVRSSSMGRLFDAVSALLDICHRNDYEGEAPIELEYLAQTAQEEYPLSIRIGEDENGVSVGETSELFLAIGKALEKGVAKNAIARGFIRAVSDWTVCMAEKLWERIRDGSRDENAGGHEGERRQIALGGGTFLNRLLLEMLIPALEERGFLVYINEQVPPSDGGIALGQAYLGALQD